MSRQEHPKLPKIAERVIFKGDNSLDVLLKKKVMGEIQSELYSSHVRLPYETNPRQ